MQEKKPSLEETLTQFMASTAANFKTMETQIGQLANAINSRSQGSLPSNTEPNLRQDGKAHYQAVTLYNGRELQEVIKEPIKAKGKEVISEENEKKVEAPLDVNPESFTIPCTIGTHFSGRALCDLRAIINLMPYSIYRTLDLGKAKPTSITLQLADRSLTYLNEIIEDILVKIDKFIFPTDFVILDMEVDSEIPIILGRPFLATGRTLINVQNGELTMRVQDQQITFNVFKAVKFSNESDECFSVSILDNFAGKESIAERPLDPFERALLNLIDEENEEGLEVVKTLDASKFFKSRGVQSLERTAPSKILKPLIEEPSTLELKPLRSHLRYAYLDEFDTLPVIISSLLSDVRVEKLLRVFRNHKSAIGWAIVDIKGISPSFCMHKILLEDDQKPSIESQRRLNPIIKEMVKKEIIKWLDAGIIYPISDSSWVIPVQSVPKKRKITVVPNMHNELIPTRTVTGLRVCKDYRKLNKATRKDHFPLPFIDQMFDKLAGKKFYYFLDGYLGYNQIAIAPEDQEKITFTCPYSTFAFQRMLFRLCNTPATFQRCMMAIFIDMIENFLEIFVDDFSIYGDSFDECLNNLSNINVLIILRRCVPKTEMNDILKQCHASPYGGHFQGDRTATKILQSDFYWPNLFKDAHLFVVNCDRCQRTGNISRRHEMPLNTILEVELFDVWGIDFMEPFVPFFGNLYILVAVDYVSK
ncbi:DNA-directed DNA polymerase [Handroanthus impetiginosus]|uniref:DNA-directed DNA polymerase n=1 Tax=Handroanthus impetiginosus TaxID=429701 RepID=A0A2G9GPZ8_9LAMI|nr:DNA-directed DNA polymerase [Handroanthus impetiginosus]